MVALALSLVVERLLPASTTAVRLREITLVLAILVTLIPFYHGALRHLDEQYGYGTGRSTHQFSVLVDFLLLFLESLVFLALAASITRPTWFAWLFVALLGVDVTWAYLTTTFLVARSERPAQHTWLVLNLACGSIVALVIAILFTVGGQAAASVPYLILMAATARTALDYGLSWRFYVAAET